MRSHPKKHFTCLIRLAVFAGCLLLFPLSCRLMPYGLGALFWGYCAQHLIWASGLFLVLGLIDAVSIQESPPPVYPAVRTASLVILSLTLIVTLAAAISVLTVGTIAFLPAKMGYDILQHSEIWQLCWSVIAVTLHLILRPKQM